MEVGRLKQSTLKQGKFRSVGTIEGQHMVMEEEKLERKIAKCLGKLVVNVQRRTISPPCAKLTR